jgi:transcriptional regulator MraZ
MFRGRYNHTIDPKGRLSIPARFRDVLAQFDGKMVVVPNEHSLEVHPEEKVNAQPQFDTELRHLSRLYVSRAMDVSLDGAGRILLPPDTRKQAGLEREVTLVGGGRRMFEVWDRMRFEEYERTRSDSLPSLFSKLATYGV